MPGWLRTRMPFAALAVGTIALGLAVHRSGDTFGPVVRDVLGDALWGMMMAWWIGVLAPDAALRTRSATAFAICALVEVSQLLHTPSLDALRDTAGGHLVLGNGFDPRDLAAYALGVLGAALLERAVRRRRHADARGPDTLDR